MVILLDKIFNMAGLDSFTKLLLHCNGTNASTSFPDSSLSPKTVTANGGAIVSTAQSKFGGASLLINNASADYLSAPDSDDWFFDTGAWTIDMWVYRTTDSGTDEVLIDNRGTTATVGWVLFINSSDVLDSYMGGALRGNSGATTIPLNTWTHVAYVRTGDTMKIFINGTQQGGDYSFSASYSIPDAAGGTPLLRVGIRQDNLSGFRGHMDEIRVSKGIARWTANFTPPTIEYGNDGGFLLNFL